jgi:starch synthase (maltosyl-transferring)
VFLFWAEQGVRIFRVDNPHTKPLRFWEYCIGRLHAEYPDVILLSEAFTRPKLMYALAKAGFSQSYTYFTWRTSRHELTEYMRELTSPDVASFFRPNFWPNTPDILPEHLQHGGRAAFIARLVLAATLSSNYGIYGPAFELMERAARPGSGEYADNEKYEIKRWNLDDPDSLAPVIRRINRIRGRNPALQQTRDVRFHETGNEHLLCYSKRDAGGENRIVVVVNLDQHWRQGGWLDLDLGYLGLDEDETFQVHDLVGDARYLWRGRRNYVELDPGTMPVHVFHVERFLRRENDFDYYA